MYFFVHNMASTNYKHMYIANCLCAWGFRFRCSRFFCHTFSFCVFRDYNGDFLRVANTIIATGVESLSSSLPTQPKARGSVRIGQSPPAIRQFCKMVFNAKNWIEAHSKNQQRMLRRTLIVRNTQRPLEGKKNLFFLLTNHFFFFSPPT